MNENIKFNIPEGMEVILKEDIEKYPLNVFHGYNPIAAIKYKDYTIMIEVRGDISITIDGETFSEDGDHSEGLKDNEDFLSVCPTAERFEELNNANRIEWYSGKWTTFTIYTKDQYPSYLNPDHPDDTILEDNLIDAISSNLEYFKELIDNA